jgi:hypothetical protein
LRRHIPIRPNRRNAGGVQFHDLGDVLSKRAFAVQAADNSEAHALLVRSRPRCDKWRSRLGIIVSTEGWIGVDPALFYGNWAKLGLDKRKD